MPSNHQTDPFHAWLCRAAVAAVLLLLFGVLIHLARRESYWMDEGYTLRRVEASWSQLYYPFAAAAPQPADPFDTREVFDLNPPLYFALARLLAGPHPSPLALRLFSALPAVAALLALAVWARRVCGRAGGLAVALLGATSPAFIYYGHEARPYALPLAVACAMVWAGERLRLRPWARFLAIASAAAAGCLMHFAFAWWVIAWGTVFAVQWLQARGEGDAAGRRAALAGVLGTGAGALAALAAVAPQWGIFAHCRGASSWVMTPEVLAIAFALPFCHVGFTPVAPWLGVALQGALLAVLLGLARRSERRRAGALALAAWLLPLALPVIAKYWAGVAFIERYTFTALAGWLMALAWAAREAAARRGAARWAVGVLFAAILAVNLAWSARNLGKPMRFQMRPAAELLKARARPGDAYTVDPYCENHCFAANCAAASPAARYFEPTSPVPADASTIWVLAEAQVRPKWENERLDAKAWRVEKVAAPWGIELFRMTRRASQE